MYFCIEPHTIPNNNFLETSIFTEIGNLKYYYRIAKKIRIVIVKSINNLHKINKIPRDSYTYKNYRCLELNLYDLDSERDNIIISDVYDLYDHKSIKRFNLEITYDYFIQLCKYDRLDTLEYLMRNNRELFNETGSIRKFIHDNTYFGWICAEFNPVCVAVSEGHINVLRWLYDNNFFTKLTSDWFTINKLHSIALNNCRVDILNFYIDVRFGIAQYGTNHAIIHEFVIEATEKGSIEVLEWLYKNYNLIMMTSCAESIYLASVKGKVNVLEWWFEKRSEDNVPFECSSELLLQVSLQGHVNVLEWWKNSKLPLKYPMMILTKISHIFRHCVGDKYKYVNVFKWWANSGLFLDCNIDLFYNLHCIAEKTPLEILKRSNIRLKYFKQYEIFYKKQYKIYDCDWWFAQLKI